MAMAKAISENNQRENNGGNSVSGNQQRNGEIMAYRK
jgi:hypothetical protein